MQMLAILLLSLLQSVACFQHGQDQDVVAHDNLKEQPFKGYKGTKNRGKKDGTWLGGVMDKRHGRGIMGMDWGWKKVEDKPRDVHVGAPAKASNGGWTSRADMKDDNGKSYESVKDENGKVMWNVKPNEKAD